MPRMRGNRSAKARSGHVRCVAGCRRARPIAGRSAVSLISLPRENAVQPSGADVQGGSALSVLEDPSWRMLLMKSVQFVSAISLVIVVVSNATSSSRYPCDGASSMLSTRFIPRSCHNYLWRLSGFIALVFPISAIADPKQETQQNTLDQSSSMRVININTINKRCPSPKVV
jgi:hypothetical protein